MHKNLFSLILKRIERIAEAVAKAETDESYAALRSAAHEAYYAAFHLICDFVIKNLFLSDRLNDDEWIDIFRSFNHEAVLNTMKKNKETYAIEALIQFYEILKDYRIDSDYNPSKLEFTWSHLDTTFKSFLEEHEKLKQHSPEQRTSFAAQFFIKKR